MKPDTILLVPSDEHMGMIDGWGHGSRPPMMCQADPGEPWSTWCGDAEEGHCTRAIVLAAAVDGVPTVNPAACLAVVGLDVAELSPARAMIAAIVLADGIDIGWLERWSERYRPGCRLVFLADGKEVLR